MPKRTLMSYLQKSWISPVVGFSFAIVATTGVLMLLHIEAPGMKNLHEWIGLVFAIAGVLHVVLNWQAFLMYIRQQKALVVLAVVLALSIGLFAFGGGEQHRHGPPSGDRNTATADND